jgi:hypothetical protein
LEYLSGYIDISASLHKDLMIGDSLQVYDDDDDDEMMNMRQQ